MLIVELVIKCLLGVVNSNPCSCRLGQFVVHIVPLVQVELQHQAVHGSGQTHLPRFSLEIENKPSAVTSIFYLD